MATKGIPLVGRVLHRSFAHRSLARFSYSPNGFSPSGMATMGTYKVPKVENENNVSVNPSIEAFGLPLGF